MSTPSDCILVRAGDVVPQLWLNGGGETRTLLSIPADVDWTLRISLACIEKNGPFSAYPGVERWFAVVEGAGVRLSFPNGEVLVKLGDPPICFDGEAGPDCCLIGGPTQDLNLMTRGGAGTISLAEANSSWQEPFARRGFFATSSGRFHFGVNNDGGARPNRNTLILEAFSLLWDFGSTECWFEPDDGGNAGFWLGYSN